MIEKTLVLIKPDGVERGLIGKILTRFEDVGLKVMALKMILPSKQDAEKHYTEDLAKRRGEHIRKMMMEFILQAPIVAVVLEGVNAIENVRKMVGATEPLTASPGTIRGDFCHVSYAYADSKKIVVKNIIHASSSKEEAEKEIAVWFKKNEIYTYTNVHEKHVR